MDNNVWQILSIFLVLLMQSGFLLLEGGRVRAKNSINVAQKNLTDLVVVWVSFQIVGFWLMFGHWAPSFITSTDNLNPLTFIYQFAFCSTAATLLSGAVAERMSYRAYLVITVMIGAVIYPLVGRLVWGDTYNLNVTPWLTNLGFIDFAGSTVVHSTGAWIALAAVMFIGPRIGRFDENGNVKNIPANNAVISLMGAILIMLGWLGFNGGSIAPDDALLQHVLLNTLTAGVYGAAAGMIAGAWLDKGIFNPTRIVNGLIGGMVACTAGVHMMDIYDSILLGLLGGSLATFASHMLLHRFKIDDPLDVVACHGICGAFGTLMVAYCAPVASLPATGRLGLLGVQAAGIIVVLVLVMGITTVTLRVLSRFMEIRVSAEAEQLGLNYTEHGESIGIDKLKNVINSKIESGESFAGGVVLDSDDEQSDLAETLNQVIEKYEVAGSELKHANDRFQQFAETASDWLWETNTDLQITFISAHGKSETEDFVASLKGQYLMHTLNIDSSIKERVQHCINNHLVTPMFEATLISEHESANQLYLEVRATPRFNDDEEFDGFRGTLKDISLRKAAESKALYLAQHDELTKLPNRRSLSIDLNAKLSEARKTGKSVVVAGVDLDGFKAVNDAYGHLVGDGLLTQVADRVADFLRPCDSVFRTGGDEFVVVLCGLSPLSAVQVAESIAERLIEHLKEIYFVQTIDVRIGSSVGLASFPHHGDTAEELLRMADLALYNAKDRGKGVVSTFSSELDTDAKLQVQLEQDLHHALENDEFYLVYQPLVDTSSERLKGFEALIRWSHPERGEIPPGDFISVAEKLNLMDRIGAYVLDAACKFATTWKEDPQGRLPGISVNVSPQQFRNPGFVKSVSDALEKHALAPGRLELEITEDVLVHDFNAVIEILQEIRTLGVSVAVDDFGQGQTSLRYLNEFPISKIKIDRAFIKHMTNDSKAADITQTIVALGQKLGVDVLAEGVEEFDQLSLLKDWKCDQVQGFFFSKPIPGDAVTALITNGLSNKDDDSPSLKKAA